VFPPPFFSTSTSQLLSCLSSPLPPAMSKRNRTDDGPATAAVSATNDSIDGHSDDKHAELVEAHPPPKRTKQSSGSANAAAEAPTAAAAASVLPVDAHASLQSLQQRYQHISRSLQWTEVLLSTNRDDELSGDPKIILKLLQADAALADGPLVSLSHPIQVNYSIHLLLIFLVTRACDWTFFCRAADMPL
jgi:hypothetical protein